MNRFQLVAQYVLESGRERKAKQLLANFGISFPELSGLTLKQQVQRLSLVIEEYYYDKYYNFKVKR